jgi:hypothetical protein
MASGFPRTMVGGVSVPRLICGTNWLLGYSHTSRAKDRLITRLFDTPQAVADVVEVFADAGCNAIMSSPGEFIARAIREVEQRTGEPMIWIATPGGGDPDKGGWKAEVDKTRELGATFAFPHMCYTDPRIDRLNNCLADSLTEYLAYVRSVGMLPGLSTHMPESITCADASGADVVSYIQPYNAAGFLCQVETDWLQHVVRRAKKPVMTIKPLAAGRLMPATGLAFSWSTLRECDMVTVGTMSVDEAEEVIEISRACLEGREAVIDLQTTRSKRTLTGANA